MNRNRKSTDGRDSRAGWLAWEQEPPSECEIMLSILVSSGCHNKVPHFRWLNRTEMYSLVVLKAGSPGITVPARTCFR